MTETEWVTKTALLGRAGTAGKVAREHADNIFEELAKAFNDESITAITIKRIDEKPPHHRLELTVQKEDLMIEPARGKAKARLLIRAEDKYIDRLVPFLKGVEAAHARKKSAVPTPEEIKIATATIRRENKELQQIIENERLQKLDEPGDDIEEEGPLDRLLRRHNRTERSVGGSGSGNDDKGR